ncbi:MAG: DNA-3-methyladenine glycosylase [Calditrichaeota bacterium]|nr:DNA-3-methyladenine glycosylase [Calditrichota bacterium]
MVQTGDPLWQHPLPRSFFARPTLTVAQGLLGHLLVRTYQSHLLVGRIVETEAYIGKDDPACHAARGRTPRNAVMFGPPGYSYIYFIYGKHYCLNVVTEPEGFPAAVLIRALEPVEGIEWMQQLRSGVPREQLTNGPGKLCQALALDHQLNGIDMCRVGPLYIVPGTAVAREQIVQLSRIGIKQGTEHPWRFYVKGNPFVSRP